MFLLVRALTKDWRAAFLAGLLFAFAPYRFNQASHLQVMSAQWMPFALYGFHRAAATRRAWPLVGGAVALAAQNLSCGYFMVFFSIFVPPFVVFELARHRRLLDGRLWLGFVLAAALVAALTLPFMTPYFALRDMHATRRNIDEVETYSADALGWVTADAESRVWGWLQVQPKAEGALFPGALPVAFAGLAFAGGLRRAWRAVRDRRSAETSVPPAGRRAWARPVLLWLGIILAVAGTTAVVLLLAGLGGVYSWLGVEVRIKSLSRPVWLSAAGAAVLLWASPRARRMAVAASRSPLVFASVCALVAAYLSLGPDPQAAGESLSAPGLYRWLYHIVPGFDGLRVPARFAMVATLFLTCAAAWGLRDLLRAAARRTGVVMAAVGAAWLVEAAMWPLPIDVPLGSETRGVRPPPPHVSIGRPVPALYAYVATLPAEAILLEFPLGDTAWEIRHTYNSIFHWRRLVNGYSGYFPARYIELADAVRNVDGRPDFAWRRVLEAGATHIVVHDDAYQGEKPPAPDAWLTAQGARLVATTDGHRVYETPRPVRSADLARVVPLRPYSSGTCVVREVCGGLFRAA